MNSAINTVGGSILSVVQCIFTFGATYPLESIAAVLTALALTIIGVRLNER